MGGAHPSRTLGPASWNFFFFLGLVTSVCVRAPCACRTRDGPRHNVRQGSDRYPYVPRVSLLCVAGRISCRRNSCGYNLFRSSYNYVWPHSGFVSCSVSPHSDVLPIMLDVCCGSHSHTHCAAVRLHPGFEVLNTGVPWRL